MQGLLRDLETIGGSEAAVLLEGETGVGKNLVARSLHEHSRRSARPFVSFNAANLPEELFESELFGHVRGAFSGAYGDHKGLAKHADGGTLFIDEVGELSLANQAKLLSFLDRMEVRPVGGLRSTAVDLRLISATNRDLRKQVEEKAFRRDLYYRLRVIALRVPSLRERREDIPLLAEHFLRELCHKYGKNILGFSQPAIDRMVAHSWEGNVRELQNEVERVVVLTREGEEISVEALSIPDKVHPSESDGPSLLRESRHAAERNIIQQTLQRHRWNVSATARELGVSRVGLTRKLKRLGIRRPGT